MHHDLTALGCCSTAPLPDPSRGCATSGCANSLTEPNRLTALNPCACPLPADLSRLLIAGALAENCDVLCDVAGPHGAPASAAAHGAAAAAASPVTGGMAHGARAWAPGDQGWGARSACVCAAEFTSLADWCFWLGFGGLGCRGLSINETNQRQRHPPVNYSVACQLACVIAQGSRGAPQPLFTASLVLSHATPLTLIPMLPSSSWPKQE